MRERKGFYLNHISFKDFPSKDRPYEKFQMYGAESLSDAELLAIILRSGTKQRDVMEIAQSILSYNQKSLMNLCEMTVEELMAIPGIGMVKATQLKCVAQLCVRMSQTPYMSKEKFDTAEKIARYYMEYLRHEDTEKMILLMMDTKCRKLGEEIISKGTVNASLASPREILLAALNKKAVQMVLIHNHPSGDPKPSTQDIQITRQIYECGELIGIKLVDHIIIGDTIYTSFREEGLL